MLRKHGTCSGKMRNSGKKYLLPLASDRAVEAMIGCGFSLRWCAEEAASAVSPPLNLITGHFLHQQDECLITKFSSRPGAGSVSKHIYKLIAKEL